MSTHRGDLLKRLSMAPDPLSVLMASPAWQERLRLLREEREAWKVHIAQPDWKTRAKVGQLELAILQNAEQLGIAGYEPRLLPHPPRTNPVPVFGQKIA